MKHTHNTFTQILRTACIATLALPVLALSSCSDDDPTPDPIPGGEKGLFIINEGNFMYGNASLSFYNPEKNTVSNEIFATANAQKLGDTATSMTIYKDKGWVVVNNSNVVYAIDIDDYELEGQVTGLVSPRYIHFLNDKKAYVTQMYDNRIAIVNPKTYSVTSYITVPDMEAASGSTEQMVELGDYLYVNCWSMQKSILKIDTKKDEVVATLEVGIQPVSLVVDKNGKLWTLCDGGGWEGNPIGYEAPSLVQIDPETMTVEKTFKFELGTSVSELTTDGSRSTLYWLSGSVYKMGIADTALPAQPCLDSDGSWFYGLTVNPANGEIYASDAIDYQQPGIVKRYSANGELLDSFYVGIIPGAFCWK